MAGLNLMMMLLLLVRVVVVVAAAAAHLWYVHGKRRARLGLVRTRHWHAGMGALDLLGELEERDRSRRSVLEARVVQAIRPDQGVVTGYDH